MSFLKIEEQRMKHDFEYYVSKKIFIPYTNKRYIISPKHKMCIKSIMDNLFTIIQAYRGFGKSELISYCFALWRAEMWDETVLILSANQDLAYLKLDLIRNAIESNNDSLRYLYSGDMSNYTWNRGELHLIDRNEPKILSSANARTGFEEEKFTYNIKSKIYARSMFAINRGLHVDNIICDDIVVEQNSNNIEMLEATKSKFHEVITPIRNPGSRVIVVGTPQSDNDLLNSLSKNRAFKSIKIPALDEFGNVSCPELHTKEFISQQRALIGELAFDQEYMLRPKTETTSIFKWDILNKSRMMTEKMVSYYIKKHEEVVFIGVDYSIKANKEEAEKKDSDYFALVAVAFNPSTKKRRILNIYRERGIGFTQQINMTISWYYKYSADALCTEKHGFLEIFNQITNLVTTDINIVDTGNSAGKFDKIKGIPSMQWAWQSNLFEVPCGDETSLGLANILFEELNQLDKASHDDVADALFRTEKASIEASKVVEVSYIPSQEQIHDQNKVIQDLFRVW